MNETGNYVDLWQIASNEEKKSSELKNLERTVMVLGEKGSGKTTLINLMKGLQKEENPKPTSALDYSFTRRTGNNRKEIMHIYELGGGKILYNLINVPLNSESFRNFIFLLTIDLSDPSNILNQVEQWFNIIREKIDQALEDIQNKTDPTEYNEFIKQSQAQASNLDDRDKINVSPIPIIVIANKYDLIEEIDGENRKWISRILRYMCHINGASLFYCSAQNQRLSQQIRTVLNSYLYGGQMSNYYQTDHLKPVFSTFGTDTISKIGLPYSNNMSGLDILRKISNDYFPSGKNKSKQITQLDYSKYPEPKIDSTRIEKDKEIERIIKSMQAQPQPKAYKSPNTKIEDNKIPQTDNKQSGVFKRFRPTSGKKQQET